MTLKYQTLKENISLVLTDCNKFKSDMIVAKINKKQKRFSLVINLVKNSDLKTKLATLAAIMKFEAFDSRFFFFFFFDYQPTLIRSS